MIDRICLVCSKPFKALIGEVNRGKGIVCSRSCASARSSMNRVTLKGPDHPRWKGGNTAKNRYEAKNPEKNIAHEKTRSAIKQGILVREPCEVCGATKVDAHHDDYTKPLDVRWLCPTHHRAHHRNERLKAKQTST